MTRNNLCRLTRAALLGATILGGTTLVAPLMARADMSTAIAGNNGTLPLPTGLYVTPTAITGAVQIQLNPNLANYPNFVAGEAVKAVVSPDGSTLAILTAGMNSLYQAWNSSAPTTAQVDYAASTQFIFIYDISGRHEAKPALKQVLPQNNSHVGLAWNGNNTLYAAGGNDDAVYVYTRPSAGSFSLSKTIGLGHYATTPTSLVPPNNSGNPADYRPNKGLGLGVQPNASGLAVSHDGATLVVANNYNDSITVIDTATGNLRYEWDLRPSNSKNENHQGAKGGTFPYSVAMNGNVAYVGADRDREVVVIDTAGNGGTGSFVGRIPLNGNPNGMALSSDGKTLFVAQDNSDQVAVISTASNTVTKNIDTRGPASLNLPTGLTSAAPTAVTINRNTLYAVNAGSNSVAVIPLTGPNALTTVALLPTAYDPTDIAFNADGSQLYIVNGKSDTGPNAGYGYGNTGCIQNFAYPVPAGASQTPPAGFTNGSCATTPTDPPPQGLTSNQTTYQNTITAAQLTDNNQYQFQLEHATLVSAPVPTVANDLSRLTKIVAGNNGYTAQPVQSDAHVMKFLHDHIQHVIYIVKENRTFDQILGDLKNGSNGDPSLTLFGKAVTPSFHRMAQDFVTLDNFFDPGDGSMDGWSWSMRGRVTNTETISQQENYARVNRGLSYEGEGQNRNIPANLPTVAGRNFFFDPTGATTPYSTNTASLSGGTANILAGDGDHAATDGPGGYQKGYIFNVVLDAGHTIRNYGWMANTPGSVGTIASPISDPFTAGVVQTTAANNLIYSNNFYDPHFRAYDQVYPDVWRTNEFIRDVTANGLKDFSFVRGLSHDHTGSFGAALAGVNTPELQQADNDYAVGKLVDWIAHNPQYRSNTLFVIIEDDCQDGADHVDSHRATTWIVGPYVKHHAIVSTRYNQVNALRTIEDIFGAKHINLQTASARPMADVFDIWRDPNDWTFNAVASTLLKNTTVVQLDEGNSTVQFAEGPDLKPTHDAAWWEAKTRGFDFSGEDRVPPDLYNEVLWDGLMAGKPYPVLHSNTQALTSK